MALADILSGFFSGIAGDPGLPMRLRLAKQESDQRQQEFNLRNLLAQAQLTKMDKEQKRMDTPLWPAMSSETKPTSEPVQYEVPGQTPTNVSQYNEPIPAGPTHAQASTFKDLGYKGRVPDRALNLMGLLPQNTAGIGATSNFTYNKETGQPVWQKPQNVTPHRYHVPGVGLVDEAGKVMVAEPDIPGRWEKIQDENGEWNWIQAPSKRTGAPSTPGQATPQPNAPPSKIIDLLPQQTPTGGTVFARPGEPPSVETPVPAIPIVAGQPETKAVLDTSEGLPGPLNAGPPIIPPPPMPPTPPAPQPGVVKTGLKGKSKEESLTTQKLIRQAREVDANNAPTERALQAKADLKDMLDRDVAVAGTKAAATEERKNKVARSLITPTALEYIYQYLKGGAKDLPPEYSKLYRLPAAQTEIGNYVAERSKEEGITGLDRVVGVASYRANSSALNDLTKREALIGTFTTRIDETSDKVLGPLAKKWDLQNPRFANWTVNKLAEIMGSGDLASLKLALNSVSQEVGKVEFNSLGIQQLTDSASKLMNTIHDPNLKVSELLKVIQTGKDLGKTAMDSIKKQKKELTTSMKGGIKPEQTETPPPSPTPPPGLGGNGTKPKTAKDLLQKYGVQ